LAKALTKVWLYFNLIFENFVDKKLVGRYNLINVPVHVKIKFLFLLTKNRLKNFWREACQWLLQPG
jgi:hypothetical protein